MADFDEEERVMLLNTSFKKFRAALDDYEDKFRDEINRRFNLDDSLYEGYTKGFSDGNGFARVIIDQTAKLAEIDSMLKRCEKYIKPGVDSRCYEVMLLIYKRRIAKMNLALDYLNSLVKMAGEETFVDFVSSIEGEAYDIDFGETLGLGGRREWGGFSIGVAMQHL